MVNTKITVSQKEFLKAITIAGSCIKGNITNPIYSCIRLSWGNNRIKIEAVDAVSGISSTIAAECGDEGCVYVYPSTISEYVASLGGPDVVISINSKGELCVSSGKSHATMSVVNVDNYPVISMDQGDSATLCSTEDIVGAIKWASIAIAQDESRPVLTGVLFKTGVDGVLRVVGSDGYRLSLSTLAMQNGAPIDLLIPQKPLIGFLRDWQDLGESVSMWVDRDGSRIWMAGKNRLFYIRLIQGSFPDFNKILPSSSLVKVSFDRGEFSQAVKQISLFARQAANIVQCEVGDKALRLYAQGGAMGSAEASVDIAGGTEKITIAFNYRYLMDYVKAVEGDEVVMICNGPLAPVQFTDSSAKNALHIIMPVKT